MAYATTSDVALAAGITLETAEQEEAVARLLADVEFDLTLEFEEYGKKITEADPERLRRAVVEAAKNRLLRLLLEQSEGYSVASKTEQVGDTVTTTAFRDTRGSAVVTDELLSPRMRKALGLTPTRSFLSIDYVTEWDYNRPCKRSNR